MYGAPLTKQAKTIMLLGSGEIGKEVAIEAQRLGLETIAVDRYEQAPAMQVAHRFYTMDMLDGEAIRNIVQQERPDFIVPEIEAIATDTLVELEKEGFNVIPTAQATNLTMDREGIRRLAAEELDVPTAKYAFANNLQELKVAVQEIGLPCVIKPIMSSSGKGQNVCRSEADVESVWNSAIEEGRGNQARVIVEELIHFESEITLLTVRSVTGTSYCAPIGHEQKDGDYIMSWQPHTMSEDQRKEAEQIAKKVTDALGGYGVFGVELFITPEKVYFSEVSPRPHDTGLVTLVTQSLSEFALHVRAVLGLPIPEIKALQPGASHALKASEESLDYQIKGLDKALAVPESQVRLFGKPYTKKGRRMGVALSNGDTVDEAKARVSKAAAEILIHESETQE